MKENISKHIINLLKHHDCVVLPNFGGLILQPIGSTLVNNQFAPPAKKIAFNENLKVDDGLLTGAIMSSDNLNYKDAKSEVFKFSNSLAYQLKKDSQVVLNGLGKFLITNKQVKFQPFSTHILNKSSFGLPKIEVATISRDLIEEKKQKLSNKRNISIQKETKKTKRKSYKSPIALILVLLTIGFLSSLIFSNHTAINKMHQNAGFIDLFFSSDTPNLDLSKNVEEIMAKNLLSQREYDGQDAVEYLKVSNDFTPKGFLIIVGSYASQTNAKRMENKLFNDGYDSYIIPTENGFFRVGIYASENLRSSTQILETLQAQYKGAWMVRNN